MTPVLNSQMDHHEIQSYLTNNFLQSAKAFFKLMKDSGNIHYLCS